MPPAYKMEDDRTGYKVLKTDAGYLVRYRLPKTIRPVYIPAETEEQVNYIIGRLNLKDPRLLNLLYRNRARMAKNASQDPKKVSSAILKALKQYLFADWGVEFSSFKDAVKKRYAKYKPFILSARRKPYAVSGMLTKAKGGGDAPYASVFMPVPTKKGVTIGGGPATAPGILKTAKGADPKEYPKTIIKLKRSPSWRAYLETLKKNAKSETIMNGKLARELYAERPAA